MFGFIKKLFGGIMNFLGGLFGSKKTQEQPAANQKKKQGGYYLELDESQGKNGEGATPPSVTTPTALKQSPTSPTPAPQPTLESTTASMNGKREKTPAPGEDTETFAPKYLMPQATRGRRRPGPNMNTFRDLARQVKTPNNA